MSIDVTVEQGVCTIVINRPERLNAMDAEHYRALSQAWCRVRDDPDITVAIVTGAGEKSFTAGADIKSFLTGPPGYDEMWLTQRDQLLNRGLEVWKPVIAAVNGYCLGGGMTLMLAAHDYARRIAANAPLALQAAKELALRSRDIDLATGLRMEQVINRMLMATDDAREGPAAFAEKRAP